MRIATWNINSVRIRLQHIKRFVEQENPDILCLQETKVEDGKFPQAALRDMGFEHVIFRGEKSYNGVAIVSKSPLENVQKLDMGGARDTRHIAAVLPGGIELHNFYIPAGGDEPDVVVNPKFKFKLDFVDDMRDWFGKNRKASDKVVIVGDFNIAPLEHDVWSSKQLRNTVSHTAVEIEKLNRLKNGLGWIDAARHFVPEDEKLYSWWSYRNKDWQASNRGRRLDHIWTTPKLESALKGHKVTSDTRNWEKPSDHAPVVVDLG